MLSPSNPRKKPYTPPKLNKLTPEQGNLILIGHANVGDQGAKDLLEVLYKLNEPDGPEVYAQVEEEEPTQIGSKLFRLIRRVLITLRSKREHFRHFVRG